MAKRGGVYSTLAWGCLGALAEGYSTQCWLIVATCFPCWAICWGSVRTSHGGESPCSSGGSLVDCLKSSRTFSLIVPKSGSHLEKPAFGGSTCPCASSGYGSKPGSMSQAHPGHYIRRKRRTLRPQECVLPFQRCGALRHYGRGAERTAPSGQKRGRPKAKRNAISSSFEK